MIMKITIQTCPSLAEYYFANVTPTVVSSSVNSGTQPQIKFPSYVNSANSAYDPVVSNKGLEISYQKYVTISAPWVQSSDVCTEVNFWFYYASGTPGEFAGISIQNFDGNTKYMVLKGESGTQIILNLYIGSLIVPIGTINHGWNAISFGKCAEFLNTYMCQVNCTANAYNGYIASIGGSYVPGTNILFLGCMTCTDSSVSYIIHSMKAMKTNSTCVFTPTINALTNNFFPCGDGLLISGEECDDYNLNNGDGCNQYCKLESGYTCFYDWTVPYQKCDICGNGKRTQVEICDDGNLANGDGCNSSCNVESGYYCVGGSPTSKDTCYEICGDGKRFNSISTYCDDWNNYSGDGCSYSCSIESGWICSGGTTSSKDACTEICGDGKRFNSLSTYCDDGNTVSGDGCSSTCAKETGWICSGGTSSSKDVCSDICADGKKYTSLSTFCDDGNVITGDGCSSTCSIESGWICTGGSPTSKDTCSEICGDGIRFNYITTYCDDGNTISGDGCSSVCAKEVGWLCSGGSTTSKDICTEICGDGKRFNSLTSYCDDGNSLNGDGCSLSCSTESGWTCTGGNASTKDICSEVCGDGIRFNTLSAYCDDGNTKSGDGCNTSCSKETGWSCINGSSTSPDVCTEICGDGLRFNSLSTYCDDGNNYNGDGCNSLCSVESGYSCSGGSSTAKDTCTEICGDGIRFNILSTYCDDGNKLSGDGCSSTCSKESGWTCSGGSINAKDTCSEICGDGKRFNSVSTYCDDGNNSNGDGCTSSCTIESGWHCSGGSSATKDSCTEICGDGIRFNSLTTYCDDGNKINGDGCSSSCSVEVGFSCSGGTSSTVDICTEKCGDGIRYNSILTYCDDGNIVNGDGCNSLCGIESGWTCSGGSSTSKDTCTEICGDGKRFNSLSTYCDDGNKINGDGCSSACSVETYWSCSGGSSTNKDSCIELCGDGKRFNSISTYCDDGNIINNDGCSSTCSAESGWTCSGGSSTTKDICVEICGDGKRFNTITTYCDDGNTLNGDGCNSFCSIETGWTCSGGTSTLPDTCVDICGDGKKYGSLSTKCDDGNKVNGDGCSMSCNVEVGWTCSGGTPTSADTCTEICGDGIRFNIISTYCDDGNLANGDGCSSTCVKETGWVCGGGSSTSKDICNDICGDGKKYSSAINFCDNGNTINNDGCNSFCVIETGWTCTGGTPTNPDTCTEICGDGIRFNSISTYCDDGNLANNDGCNSSCQIETGWTCFGGTSSNKDTCNDICGDGKKYSSLSTFCDDGNKLSGDGCSSSCFIESGWGCSGGTSTNKDTCTEICGDGIRFNVVSTYCDDGNTISGDGCSSTCIKEIGWNCSGGSMTSKDSCSEICGDGIRFNTISSYCDDENIISGDGCSSICAKESGWICSGGTSNSKDICKEICGDGVRFNALTTYCDDGNTLNGDGCNSLCGVETGYSCTGGSTSSKDICTEACGDGIRLNFLYTYCDDENNQNGDGCSSTCGVESGWSCAGGSISTRDRCTEICGDGIRFNSLKSYCDDGNNINNDGCSMACGTENGWICNGGNSTQKDSCSEICGDGIKFNNISTYCDDRNLKSGDGCSSSCKIESGWICSGGSVFTNDSCDEICGDGKRFNKNSKYCDDGNLVDGDGCNSNCTVEWQYTCKGGNSTSKDICKYYYTATSQEISAALSNQVSANVGIGVSAGTSILTMSSFNGAFAMINQFQMLLILMISGVYLSDGVKVTIVGMNFTMLNFNFIKLENLNFFKYLFDIFSFAQQYQNLDEIGISSGNTFINIFKLMFLIIIFILLHIILYPIISKLRSCRRESKYKIIGDKLFQIFTFSIYVRVIIQAFLVILLSAVSEISLFSVENPIRIISLSLSCLLCISLFFYFMICWYQIWKAHSDITLTNQIYFLEFFNGIKNNTYARIFPAVHMMQRILCVILLIIFEQLNEYAKISLLTIIHLSSLVYFLIVRPFDSKRDCILESLSQALVTTFTSLLIYFCYESEWNNVISWVFISMIICTNIIFSIICIIDFIIIMKNKLKNCRRKQKVVDHQDQTKPELSVITSKLAKMQEMIRIPSKNKEEYKIDLSESDPTLVNIHLDIERPKKILQFLSKRKLFNR